VRIADVLFRRGHLSEDALTSAILSGQHPVHLERCDDCSRRARELGLWLTDLRAEALAAADDAFPPERLALQQSQIMRRLEQLDAPPRVIAFPAQAVGAPRMHSGRRVAPAWLGVAAAAGLVIGVIGGQVSARLTPEAGIAAPAPEQTQQAEPAPNVSAPPVNASLLDYDLERHIPDSLLIYDEATPTLVQAQYASSR
jgi:hypothetical protein